MGIASEKTNPKLRSSVVINLVRTLTLTLLSFITFPFVTRILGDSLFGWYTWANTFVYYFLILAKISIPNIAIRECAKVKSDRKALSKKVQGFFLLQSITTLLSFGSMVGIMAMVPSLWSSNELIFLLSINFLSGAFSFEWVYIALEKHAYITVRSISLIALSALMTFLFLRHYETPAFLEKMVYVYALIAVSSTLLTSLINVLVLHRYIDFSYQGPYGLKEMVKPLFVLFLISAALTLYNQTDAFLLGFISSNSSVGAYSVGVKGIDIVITLITSLYAVFLPKASELFHQQKEKEYRNLISYSFNITFFIAVPAIATMIALATPITALISGSSDQAAGQYADANLVLVILALMMLTYSIGDNIYNEILLPQKREKTYLLAMFSGFLLNVGLSFFFAYVCFPERKILGVAIATAAADLLILVYLLLSTRKWSSKALFSLNNLKIVLVGVVLFLPTHFLSPLISNLFVERGVELWQSYLLTLVIAVVIDAIVYLGLLALLRENIVFSLLPKWRKKDAE